MCSHGVAFSSRGKPPRSAPAVRAARRRVMLFSPGMVESMPVCIRKTRATRHVPTDGTSFAADGNIDLLFVGNHDHAENLDAWRFELGIGRGTGDPEVRNVEFRTR